MLSRLAGPDRDQSKVYIWPGYFHICHERLLLIRSTRGLVCPSEKSNRQFLFEEFNKKKYNKKKYYN